MVKYWAIESDSYINDHISYKLDYFIYYTASALNYK